MISKTQLRKLDTQQHKPYQKPESESCSCSTSGTLRVAFFYKPCDKSWMWKYGVVITTNRTHHSTFIYIIDKGFWWVLYVFGFFGGFVCLFVFIFYFVLCCLSLSCILSAQYCQCLWIVHSWLSIRMSIKLN